MIETLAARLEEVTRERDEARAALHDTPAGKLIVAVLGKEVRAVEDERDRLQAENERLVAVLDEIMMLELTHEAGPMKRRLRTIMEREAALRETGGEKGGGRG